MAQPVDLILENAQIITMEPCQPQAEALAVAGGRILAVGSRGEIDGLSGSRTRRIDCGGKTLVPGFNDVHLHFFSSLRKVLSLDLSPDHVKSIAGIQAAIQRKVQYLPAGTWIAGTDYNEFYLAEKRHPTCRDLDAISPEHPVILTHRSLHACVLNSAALHMVGINNESEEPEGGLIDRDLESGEPSGILYEMLSWVQSRIKSPLSEAEKEWAVAELNRRYLSYGLTSFTDATITNDLRQWKTFNLMVQERKLHSRVHMMAGVEHLPEFTNAGLKTGSGSDACRLGSLKMVISQATGRMRPTQDELNQMILSANRAGFQAAVHAVEKESVEAAATALEYAGSHYPIDLRNRIEHCSECDPAVIARLAALRTVIASQPPFFYYHGERYLQEVPPAILPILYPFGSWQAAGLVSAGSSDAPVVDNNPLTGIFSAVTRQARSGQVLQPQERLTPPDALALYTSHAAYAQFAEKEKGSLCPGKLADIVMLSDNPLQTPAEAIKDIHVEMTIINGEVVWERGQVET